MSDKTSKRLESKIPEIMDIWEERALQEIIAANYQNVLALRNTLPNYLSQLVDALSNTIDRTAARKRSDKMESTRIGKEHGKIRAMAQHYTMDQMILEYHILRQVICDVMEETVPLNPIEREIIVCSIEQAVNDAATQFSDSLRELQKKLSTTLAHDLRNPLTSAKMSTQLIIKNPANEKNTLNSANRISSSLDRIDKMITELLDASRLSSEEKNPLKFKSFDLDWLVREIASEFNIVYADRVTVQSAGNCTGNWNEDGVRRLIENLVTNAIKYSTENSLVSLSLEQDEDTATIVVHNDGEPISHADQLTLFEDFKRARSAEDKVGWGLGLTVVKGMVDAHKGSIVLESEKDKGTTFEIKLPKYLSKYTVEHNSYVEGQHTLH